MGEAVWYFRTLGGDEVGPITADELRSHAARGAIGAETPVRKGQSGWRAAGTIRGLGIESAVVQTASAPTASDSPPVTFAPDDAPAKPRGSDRMPILTWQAWVLFAIYTPFVLLSLLWASPAGVEHPFGPAGPNVIVWFLWLIALRLGQIARALERRY